MSKVTLFLCALLIAALISQGKGCFVPNCRACGRALGRFLLPMSDRQDYSFNYSEMVDRIKHPGLMSAVEAYDTDKDGIISGEENTVIIEKATMVFNDTDTDKDGQLDAQELQQFVHEMTNKSVDKVFSEQEQQQIFADLDNDGNGALTKEEMNEPTVVEDILKAFVTSERDEESPEKI